MRKNSIRERAKRNSPEVKHLVKCMNHCLDALSTLEIFEIVNKKESLKLHDRITKEFTLKTN